MKQLFSMAGIALILAAISSSAFLSACNTMHGFGKDVERGGERVQDAADKTQKQM